MGVDIHVVITKYNRETNFYEKLSLYQKDSQGSYKEVKIWFGRDGEMFDAISNQSNDETYGVFPSRIIAFNSLEPELREYMRKERETFGCYDFSETTLEELKTYCETHKKVKDYDSEWEENNPILKKNPIREFYKKIRNYISVADEDWGWTDFVLYKILIYFDH